MTAQQASELIQVLNNIDVSLGCIGIILGLILILKDCGGKVIWQEKQRTKLQCF